MNRFIVALALAIMPMGAAPVSAMVTEARVERASAERVTISWRSEGAVNVYETADPSASVAAATLISADDRDGRHDIAMNGARRRYFLFLLRDNGDGSLVRVGERVIPLAQGANFRDLGGYRTADGRHVRWGLIYRAAATAMLTPEDVERVDALGLHDMIDLRSNEERILAPSRVNGVRYAAIGYPLLSASGVVPKAEGPPADPRTSAQRATIATYRGLPDLLAPQMRLLFDTLREGRGPLEFNCSAGQDRTGLAAGLILAALGVPRDAIYADYLLSMKYRRAQFIMPPPSPAMIADNPVAAMFAGLGKGTVVMPPLYDGSGKPYLAYAFEEIDRRWGSIDAYLKDQAGLDDDGRSALRARYLE